MSHGIVCFVASSLLLRRLLFPSRRTCVTAHSRAPSTRAAMRCSRHQLRIRRAALVRARIHVETHIASSSFRPRRGIRRHTEAYGGIRRHTEAYGGIRRHTEAHGGIRRHTEAYGGIRRHTEAYGGIRSHTEAYGAIRRHTEAYGAIRRHTEAYGAIRRHTEAYGSASASPFIVRGSESPAPSTPAPLSSSLALLTESRKKKFGRRRAIRTTASARRSTTSSISFCRRTNFGLKPVVAPAQKAGRNKASSRHTPLPRPPAPCSCCTCAFAWFSGRSLVSLRMRGARRSGERTLSVSGHIGVSRLKNRCAAPSCVLRCWCFLLFTPPTTASLP